MLYVLALATPCIPGVHVAAFGRAHVNLESVKKASLGNERVKKSSSVEYVVASCRPLFSDGARANKPLVSLLT